MTERYVCIRDSHRKFFIDFGDDLGGTGKIVIGEEVLEGSYAVYWRSQSKIGDFLRYMDELHKRGHLINGEGVDPHIAYHYMQDGDDISSPSGNISKILPTVRDMLECAKRETRQREGRLLRLDTYRNSYIWDDYMTPWLGLTIAVINDKGTPADNIIELFKLSFPGVDEELLTILQKELPPTAPSPRQ